MLFGTLEASLLGNILAGKRIVRAGSSRRFLNSSTLYIKKEKELSELVMEKNGIFNPTSSFNKF